MTKITDAEDFALTSPAQVAADLEQARRDAGGPVLRFTEDDARFVFDSARDAIDAISQFEAATFADWEYRLEACEKNSGLRYRVALNSVTRGDHRRGFLQLV